MRDFTDLKYAYKQSHKCLYLYSIHFSVIKSLLAEAIYIPEKLKTLLQNFYNLIFIAPKVLREICE